MRLTQRVLLAADHGTAHVPDPADQAAGPAHAA